MKRLVHFCAQAGTQWLPLLCLALLVGGFGARGQTYRVQTIAGGVANGYSGDGGPALSAAFGTLGGLAADANGNVYVADSTNQRVRLISGGIVSTAIGTGSFTPLLDTNQLALETNLLRPEDVEFGPDGQLYVSDLFYIRRWDRTSGPLTRIAGRVPSVDGSGSNQDGTPALSSYVTPPYLAIDRLGQPIFSENVPDLRSFAVRMIENGFLRTIAGRGTTILDASLTSATPGRELHLPDPRGVAVRGRFVYICDHFTGVVSVTDMSSTNRLTDVAVVLRKTQDIAAGKDERLYILWEPRDGSQRISSFGVLADGKLSDRRDIIGGGLDTVSDDVRGETVFIAGGARLTVSPTGQVYYTENQVSTSDGPVSRIRMATPTEPPPEAEPCEFRTESPLPAATLGIPYQTDIRYSGNTPPTPELEAAVRNLLGDASLRIEILHGLRFFRITGTPTIIGDKVFQLTLPCGAVQVFRLPIRPPTASIEVLPAELPPATQGCQYSATFSASGGSAPYLMTIGSSPISSTTQTLIAPATISGTPPLAGTFPVSVQVADTLSRVGTRTYQFTVHPKATIASTGLPPGRVGIPYRALISAQDGVAPLRWGDPVALPAGLVLGSDGSISGTPTAPFNGAIIVEVTDANNCGTQASLPLVIEDLPETLPESLDMSFSNDTIGIGEDFSVSLRLSPAPSKSHEGVIRLEFIPSQGTGIDTNPEVVFLTDPASDMQRFHFPPSTTAALFPGANDGGTNLRFRTGTVAGTVRLTATLNEPPLTAIKEIPISAQPPELDDLSVTRAGSQLKVHAAGFASERSVGSGRVRLQATADATVEGGGAKPLPEVFLQEFVAYFMKPESKVVGSQFVLVFDISLTNGQASQISELCLQLDGRPGMVGQERCAIPQ